jgi:hypothetical protein
MVVFIGAAVVLVYRFGWWWLGALVALYIAIAVTSIIVRGRRGSKDEKLLRTLRIPLYGLYHIRDIEQSATGEYIYDIVPTFKERYSPAQQDDIVKAIEIAIADRDLDLEDALPHLPFGREDIVIHLEHTLRRLKSLK